MKSTHALVFLLVLALSAVWTGVEDYKRAEREIAHDLTQALCQTMATKPTDWLSADTIQCYRSHLQLESLRQSAMLSLWVTREGRHPVESGISGKSICIMPSVQACGNVSLSAWEVWRMGDHRLSLALSLLTLVWMVFSLRSVVVGRAQEGGIRMENGHYFDGRGEELRLTPMQRQLMEMFLAAPRHELTKEEICEALWPRKDDASDTLYALISRTKAAVESRTGLQIASERGRSYRLLGLR